MTVQSTYTIRTKAPQPTLGMSHNTRALFGLEQKGFSVTIDTTKTTAWLSDVEALLKDNLVTYGALADGELIIVLHDKERAEQFESKWGGAE